MVRCYRLALGLLLSVAACSSWQVGPFEPEPPTPLECEPTVIPSPDPNLPDTVIPGVCEDCLSACNNLKKLGCPEGDDQCVPACENAEDQGTLKHVNFACLTWATSCSAAEKC